MTDLIKEQIEGQTIEKVRSMTEEEMEEEGGMWESHSPRTITVLELDNGATIYSAKDPEGNGPGALFGRTDSDLPIRVIPTR